MKDGLVAIPVQPSHRGRHARREYEQAGSEHDEACEQVANIGEQGSPLRRRESGLAIPDTSEAKIVEPVTS
jgi:hypothetical protein